LRKLKINQEQDLVEILQRRRKELGITQKELAAFCNLSHNGISKFESGNSDVMLSTILKMSKMLGFEIVIELQE
jgi:transcriptional regulator with XRE-family HTH domain